MDADKNIVIKILNILSIILMISLPIGFVVYMYYGTLPYPHEVSCKNNQVGNSKYCVAPLVGYYTCSTTIDGMDCIKKTFIWF